jgi:hypothetical protein
MSDETCLICGRNTPEKFAEKHHLTPVSKKGRRKEKALVCIDCGDHIHEVFTNNELRDNYNSLEALRTNERIQKWIKWIRKQKKFGVCHKKKKRR